MSEVVDKFVSGRMLWRDDQHWLKLKSCSLCRHFFSIQSIHLRAEIQYSFISQSLIIGVGLPLISNYKCNIFVMFVNLNQGSWLPGNSPLQTSACSLSVIRGITMEVQQYLDIIHPSYDEKLLGWKNNTNNRKEAMFQGMLFLGLLLNIRLHVYLCKWV